MAVKPIPDGYHSITPYMIVEGAGALIEFMKNAFGATLVFRTDAPDGTIRHAEIKIGDSMVMMADAGPSYPAKPACYYMYVPDVDAVYAQAVEAGGVSLSEPTDQPYGDRSAGITDPSGNTWWIGTHIKDVSEEEIQQMADAQSAG